MFSSTLLTVLAIGATLVEAGFDKFKLPSLFNTHKRVTLYLDKRGAPPKQCRLKPASNNNELVTPTTTSAGSSPTGGGGGSGGGGHGKTIQVHSDQCGSPNASVDPTVNSGPNGNEDWLNCGITTSGGWNPPPIHISDLIYTDLAAALAQPGSPFTACNPYLTYFNDAASANGVPAIILASIAMEESGCNKDIVGGAGEQGIMQITKDKCPNQTANATCRDPESNIKTGASYFASVLSSANGNVAQALGMYNGWRLGLTKDQATAPANTSCCYCQNNLDYLHQQLNGWVQNVNPYEMGMGTYHNLKVCSKNSSGSNVN